MLITRPKITSIVSTAAWIKNPAHERVSRPPITSSLRTVVTVPSKLMIAWLGVRRARGSPLAVGSVLLFSSVEVGESRLVFGSKLGSIAVDVRPLQVVQKLDPQQHYFFALLFALKGRKILPAMGDTNQVENSAKHEVVVGKTGAGVVAERCDACKRKLKGPKQCTCFFHYFVVDYLAITPHSTQDTPKRQKLLLHKSVSRYKPPQHKLDKWRAKIENEQKLVVLSNACRITLLQPKTTRPGYSFVNPTKALDPRYTSNDALGFSVIMLLAYGKLPQNEWDEASHLCGNARCVNIAHLCWEDTATNFSRNLCQMYGQVCKHTPACIADVDEHEHEQLTKYLRTNLRV